MISYADLNLPGHEVDAANARADASRVLILHGAGLPVSEFVRDTARGPTQVLLAQLERDLDLRDEFYSIVSHVAVMRMTTLWRRIPISRKLELVKHELEEAEKELRLPHEYHVHLRSSEDLPPISWQPFIVMMLQIATAEVEALFREYDAALRNLADHFTENHAVRSLTIDSILSAAGLTFGMFRAASPSHGFLDYIDLVA